MRKKILSFLLTFAVFFSLPLLVRLVANADAVCNGTGVLIKGVELKLPQGYDPNDFNVGWIDFWVGIGAPGTASVKSQGYNSSGTNLDYGRNTNDSSGNPMISAAFDRNGNSLSCGKQCIKEFCIDGSSVTGDQIELVLYQSSVFNQGLRRVNDIGNDYTRQPSDRGSNVTLVNNTEFPNSVKTVSKGSAINKLNFTWNPAGVISQPSIYLSDTNVAENNPKDVKVTVTLGERKAPEYLITISGSGPLGTGVSYPSLIMHLSCENSKIRENPICKVLESRTMPIKITDLQFEKPQEVEDTIPMRFLSFVIPYSQNLPQGTYTVSVSDDRKNYFTRANAELVVEKKVANDVMVTLNPSTLDSQEQSKGKTIHVTLVKGSTESFRLFFNTTQDRDVTAGSLISTTFDCAGNGCTTTFSLPAAGVTPGTYWVTIKDSSNTTRGAASLTVQGTITGGGSGVGSVGGSGAGSPSPSPTPLPPFIDCKYIRTDTGEPFPMDSRDFPTLTIPRKCVELQTAIGGIQTDPVLFIKRLFGLILSLSGGIAIILIIISGYNLMVSQGVPEKVQGARETLTSAIVGLLFIIFSLVILQSIGVDILNIPGITP